MSDLEIRQFGFRAAVPSVREDNKLSGRAAPFNSQTMIGSREMGGFRESINPKAFNKTLIDGDQVLLDNHDAHRPLARRSAGTLELHASTSGLDWRAVAANTSYARDVVENVRAGNYGGCSFSFEVVKDKWTVAADGVDERELLEVNCREISVVTFPAYSDTTVSARSLIDAAMESRHRFWESVMEPELRDAADGDPKKPYGNVKYADPKNGKYPIDTVEHIHAAWSYINVAKNAAKYPLNGVTLSEVKARIKAAAKAHGIKIAEDEQNEALPQHVRELHDYFFGLTHDMNEDTAKQYREELAWFDNDFRIRAESEPGEPTRNLTREETALFEKRAADLRRAIYESRKASFQK